MSGPGLRLHPRTRQVAKAENELAQLLIDWEERNDLTLIEAALILAQRQQIVLKYALRAERHPNDPNHKADEA